MLSQLGSLEWLGKPRYHKAMIKTNNSEDVAIVIPCHSYIQWLPEALDSILAQTVQPRQVIMVEDGNEDIFEYDAVFKAYEGKFEFLRHVAISPAQGVCAVRNKGFKMAALCDVKWVIPLDEDDLLRPKYIEKVMLSVQVCPQAKIHYTDWNIFGDTLGHKKTPDYSFDRLLQGPFITSTALIHMDVFEAVREKNGDGYDENLTRKGLRWEDYLFYLEAGALGFDMARVGLGLLRARRHGESGTTIADATIDEWHVYAKDKLHRLYDLDVPWQSP